MSAFQGVHIGEHLVYIVAGVDAHFVFGINDCLAVIEVREAYEVVALAEVNAATV
jgi:hypothetical protein